MLKKILVTAAVAAMLSATGALAETIKIGVTPGEHAQIMEKVKEIAKPKGLDIEIFEFSDYVVPNQALNDGELDANSFQHKPYLDNQIKTQGYHIVPVGYTGVWPIGLYSKKFSKIAELPQGAVIGVPNDPSNEGRALRVLEDQGVIKLKPGTGILATIADIAENPKKVKIKELDAGIVGRSVEDLDAAVVNTDWALKSGLTPANRIAQEKIADNPYRNFIAVKAGQEKEPWVKTLVSSYQNDKVKAEFDKVYKGTGISAY